MKLAIHHIARRAKINCSEEELLTWVQDNEKLWTPGDKPGIFHCSIPANWVQGEIRTLQFGDELPAKVMYTPRPGVKEEPRRTIKVNSNWVPDAVDLADVIIYSRELLGKDASIEADYEIIVIRGMGKEANPRELNTLLHDIFGMSGGTPTSGSAEEKLEMIRKSFLFWKDKVLVSG